MYLQEGLLNNLPEEEKLVYVLNRLIMSDGRKARKDDRDIVASTDLLKAETHLVLGEEEEALSIIGGCELGETANYYNFQEWVVAYCKYLVNSGLEEEVLSLIREYMKVARDGDTFDWIGRVYMMLIGSGKLESANTLKETLIAFYPSFEARLRDLDERVEQRKRDGRTEIRSNVEAVLAKVLAFLSLERDDEAQSLIDFMRGKVAGVMEDAEIQELEDRIGVILEKHGKDGREELKKDVVEAEAAYNVLLSGDYQTAEKKLASLRNRLPINYYVLIGLARAAFNKGNLVYAHNLLQKLLSHHSDDAEACAFGARVFALLAERKNSSKRDDRRGGGLSLEVVNRCSKAYYYLRKASRLSSASGKMLGDDAFEAKKILDSLGYRPPRNVNRRGLPRSQWPKKPTVDVSIDSVWMEIKGLLLSGKYDDADATLRRFLEGRPGKGALDARKCLFEIALIKEDWGEADRLLKDIGSMVSRDMLDFYTAKLNLAKSREAIVPNGHRSNRFWDQLGSMNPVDSVAGRVTRNRRGE